MNDKNKKCVMILDEDMPCGLIANTSAVLGITLGMKMPEIVGNDVKNRDNFIHTGIIKFPVPILKGNRKLIKELRQKLYSDEYSDVTVADFSELAQSCKTYDEFTDKMSVTDENDLSYIGIAICSTKKKINKLTGNLPLL